MHGLMHGQPIMGMGLALTATLLPENRTAASVPGVKHPHLKRLMHGQWQRLMHGQKKQR